MARCKLGALLGTEHTLTHADRSTLRAVLDTGQHNGRKVTGALLSRALTAEGHAVGSTTVKDHRARRCVCWGDS